MLIYMFIEYKVHSVSVRKNSSSTMAFCRNFVKFIYCSIYDNNRRPLYFGISESNYHDPMGDTVWDPQQFLDSKSRISTKNIQKDF